MAGDPTGLSTLGTGAGIGDAIARLLAQRLAAARFAEERTQNQSENAYRNRALDLTEKTRTDALAEQTRQHDLASRASTISARSLLPPGADISEGDQAGYTKAGVGGLSTPNQTLGSTSLAGLSPLQGAPDNAVSLKTLQAPQRREGYTAQPTFDQNLKLEDLGRKRDTAEAAIGSKTKELEQAAQRLEMQGKVNEANILRMQAQAEAANAKAEKDRGAGQPSAYAAERSQRVLDSVRALKDQVSHWNTGVGSSLSSIPATNARDFRAKLDTLKGNIGFGELAAMREASKTGGALGQVSDRELTLLSSVLGSLDTGQSVPALREQLQKIEDSMMRWTAAQGGTAKPIPSHATASGNDPLGLRR